MLIVKEENGVLRKRAHEVTGFDRGLENLVKSMFRCMYSAKGVGLAAPQVGIRKRIAVIDCVQNDPSSRIVLINPLITRSSGTQTGSEGCLSIPGVVLQIKRPDEVTVNAQNVYGKEFTITGSGLLARALQHEVDHLDGLLISRFSANADSTIEDGCGSSWSKRCAMCGRLSMEVVRPGKVHCNYCYKMPLTQCRREITNV